MSAIYGPYTPDKITIDNLGINITPELNDRLSLLTEYLIVGERTSTAGGSLNNSLSLIVDSRGIAVNTSLENRRFSNYANEIHGNTYIRGNIYVSGDIFKNDTVLIEGEGGGSSGGFFEYAFNGRGIYYDGQTTFGDYVSASNNQYMVNIAKSVARDINKAQLVIQNNKNAIAKVAIIGEADVSPFIINTSSNVPIEFHVGRDRNFFSNAYLKEDPINGRIEIVNSDTPTYKGKQDSPHFNIDINGNVGIKTSINNLIRYNVRGVDEYGGVKFTSVIGRPDFYVNGTTYSSNILMYDYETDTHKNLDELYSRRDGQSIVTSNLVPGKFAKGFFEFQSNVSILCPIDKEIELKVNGDGLFMSNLVVGADMNTGKTLTTRSVVVHETASFSNNVYIQDNIYVRNNIYTYSHTANGVDMYNILSVACNVINMTNGVETDFYYYGNGYSTRGRFGVGVEPFMGDSVDNQMVISKRDPTIFELEIRDNNIAGFVKTLFIGHPKTQYANRSDGSIAFITPGPNNTVYNGSQSRAQQNIYFYPGYEPPIPDFSLNSNNPPLMGMFVNKRVGIKTFTPEFDFDVVGDIASSGSYYLKESGITVKLGVWRARSDGMFYYNEKVPYVGINTIPQNEYGLTVSGKILSLDGYYTVGGLKTIPLYNSADARNRPEQEYEYAYFRGRLGIGDVDSTGTLSIRDTFRSNTTSLKILNSPVNQISSLHFIGARNEYLQVFNDTENTFELYNGRLSTMSNNARAFITKKYPNGSNQMILNSNLEYGLKNSDCALLVNGNMDVRGNINVSGQYRVSGHAIEINAGTNTAEFYIPPNTSENVYISGEEIHLNPNSLIGGAMYIGWGRSMSVPSKTAMINVLLETRGVNPNIIFVSKYTSLNSDSCLSQYVNEDGKTMVIGLNDSRFYIGGTSVSEPYIVVGNVDDTLQNSTHTTMGIGTASPNGSKIHVYTDINGQPLATFTRQHNSSDDDAVYADLTLEKQIDTEVYRWKIHGPVFNGNTQKIQFLYEDTDGYEIAEKLCITKDGFIGINNPYPEYAVDIKGGAIRINADRPAIVFQKSDSTDYGTSSSIDYSMYSSNNTFIFESKDVLRGEQPIMHVSSNNMIGFNMLANSNYTVSIKGKLNVSDSIFIDGRSFFSVLDNNVENGSFLEWQNIFINPDPTSYGGVFINGGKTATSNVFQVNSGSNGNVAVLNSIYPQSLLHFRNLHRRPELEADEKIWRVGSSNNSFILEHRSNVFYDELLITDSAEHYGRVIEYIQSDIIGEFIERINGSIELRSINPEVSMNGINVIGTLNDNMYIMTSNLGIGTKIPEAKFHIENMDTEHSFRVSNTFVITSNGDVGIGTMEPQARVHIVGSTKFESMEPNNVFEVIGDSIFRNNITIKGNIVNDSDYRIKTDIHKIEEALTKVKKLSGYTFMKNGRKETGVIAQEVMEVLPEAVFENNDGYMGVAYGNIIGLLIEAIKDLDLKIERYYRTNGTDS
jgi:hypothetical protein